MNIDKYIITVDVGTTSTKSLAVNTRGQILAQASIPYPILSPEPEFAEQDPSAILQAVKETIRDVARQAGKNVLGVCFSSAMHSLIVVDNEGTELTNSIIWADNRSKEFAEQLRKSQQGLNIYLKTGTPVHPMSPLCKIMWLKQHNEEIFKRAHKFISIKEYIFHHFFGEFIIDHSIASATGLFDIYSLKWNEASLKLAGISEEQLSMPVPVTYFLKDLQPGIAEELGVKKDLPFVVGGSDGCLANLGANSTKSGYAAVTIGTSGAIRMACSKSQPDHHQRVFNYLLDETNFIVGGPTNNGAILLDWFKEGFLKEELKGKDEGHFHRLIEEKVNRVEPGAEGLVFLPYLLGERAPIWDANAKGVFFGVMMKHQQIHFLRAIMEGIIFGVYSIGKSLEELVGEIKVVNAGGGFAKSKFWLQMLSDVFNKKVIINNSLESSSLGAAMIGFKSLGVYENLEDLQQYIEVVEEYYPNLENHQKYMKSFEIFESLYTSLKGEFKKI